MEQQRRRSSFALHRLLTMEEVFQTFQWFAQMRANQPVFYDEQTRLWQIFRYDDVNEVITDYSRFKQLEWVPDVPVQISSGIVFVIRSLPMTFQAH